MKDKPIVKRKKEKRIIEREVVSFEIRFHFQIRHFPESETSGRPCRESSINDKRVEATRFFRPMRFRKEPPSKNSIVP